jgi:hypothetical protein
MTIGKDETVTLAPFWVSWVVVQKVAPQHFSNIGHAHRGARVAGIGFLNCIHAQCPDGIG